MLCGEKGRIGRHMTPEQQKPNKITETVIGLSYKVASTLGPGFLETVYENSLAHEFLKGGIRTSQQERLLVRYDGVMVGDFRVDLMVENELLLEIKAVSEITKFHEAQLVNYLKAARIKLRIAPELRRIFGRDKEEGERILTPFPNLFALFSERSGEKRAKVELKQRTASSRMKMSMP